MGPNASEILKEIEQRCQKLPWATQARAEMEELKQWLEDQIQIDIDDMATIESGQELECDHSLSPWTPGCPACDETVEKYGFPPNHP